MLRGDAGGQVPSRPGRNGAAGRDTDGAGRGKRDAGATQLGDAKEERGRGRVGNARHKCHKSKALRTQGTSGSLFRLKCVCEALKDSGCKGGGGSAQQRSCRSWWEFFYKGTIVRQQRLTKIQLEKWRRKKKEEKKIFSVTCALQKQPLSRSAPGRAAAALGASGLC